VAVVGQHIPHTCRGTSLTPWLEVVIVA